MIEETRRTLAPQRSAAPHAAPRRRRWLERLAIAAALIAVVWFFHWTVAAAHGFVSWGDHDYYQLLVRGFRKGQLSLDKEPSPELLALADPYDPAQNDRHRLPDASLYRGKYYLYFGPAPAVTLMWPFAAVTGRELTMGAATFVFCSAGFLAASAWWLALRRRYFPESAWWLAPLGVLALGTGTHVLALAQRPMWWELAIAAGFAFSMLALVAVQVAIHGRRPALALGAAGIFLGLAVASRPPCLFGAALLLPPLWLAWRERGLDRAWWRMALSGAAGLGVCLAAIFAYNHARFENPLEFGQNYQLSGAYEGQLEHFSARFIPHNLAVYFFQTPAWTWEFPFIAARSLPPTNLRGYFGAEEVAGLAVTCVFVWFVLALPLAWRGREGAAARPLVATLAAPAAMFVGVGALLFSMFSNTARYMVDFTPACGLLALGGVLGLERWLRAPAVRFDGGGVSPPRGETIAHAQSRGVGTPRLQQAAFAFTRGALIALPLVVTIALGVLLSFDYHRRSLARSNPELWARFERASYETLSRVGVAFGALDGPRELKVRFRAQPAGTVEPFWLPLDPRAGERIVVEHLGPREIRFGYARGDAAIRWGRPLTWEPEHTHTVVVQLPSLYGAETRAMSGLRRDVAFRERSSVAVWFSGGRALAEIVAPLPEGVAAGGLVPPTFSGEVRRVRTQPWRVTDIVDEPITTAATEPGREAGGTLRLRVRLPAPLAAEGEPLFAAGALYGSDMVFVREAAGGGVQFVFEHFGAPLHASTPVALDRAREHVVEIALPSFALDAFGQPLTGDAIVRVNGDAVLRVPSATHGFPPGHEAIAKNPFGTTCARAFRGWLLEARWVPPADAPAVPR